MCYVRDAVVPSSENSEATLLQGVSRTPYTYLRSMILLLQGGNP